METFSVDTSGTVSVKKELDYNQVKWYKFQVLAARNASGKSNNAQSLLDVNVTVSY